MESLGTTGQVRLIRVGSETHRTITDAEDGVWVRTPVASAVLRAGDEDGTETLVVQVESDEIVIPGIASARGLLTLALVAVEKDATGVRTLLEQLAATVGAPAADASPTPADAAAPAPRSEVNVDDLRRQLAVLFGSERDVPKALLAEDLRAASVRFLRGVTDEDRKYYERLVSNGFVRHLEQEVFRRVHDLLDERNRGMFKVARSPVDSADRRASVAFVVTNSGRVVPVGWLREGDELLQFTYGAATAPAEVKTEAALALRPAAPSPASAPVPPVAPTAAPTPIIADTTAVSAAASATAPTAGAARPSATATTAVEAEGAEAPAGSRTPAVPKGNWRSTFPLLKYAKIATRLNAGVSSLFPGILGGGGPFRSPLRFDGDRLRTSVLRVDGFSVSRQGLAVEPLTVYERDDPDHPASVTLTACSKCPTETTCAHRKAALGAVRAEVRYLSRAAEYDRQLADLRDRLAAHWGIRARTRLERLLRIGELKVSVDRVDTRRLSFRLVDPEKGVFMVRDEVLGRTYRVAPGECSCGKDALSCAHRDHIRQNVRHADLIRRQRGDTAELTAPSAVYRALAQWHPQPGAKLRGAERAELAKHIQSKIIDATVSKMDIRYDPLKDDAIQVVHQGRLYEVATDLSCSCGAVGCDHSRAAEQALTDRLAALRTAVRYDTDYRKVYDHMRTVFATAHRNDPETEGPIRVMRRQAGIARILPRGLRSAPPEQLRIAIADRAKVYIVEDTALGRRYEVQRSCPCGTYRTESECAHINLVRSYIDGAIINARRELRNVQIQQVRVNEAKTRAATAVASGGKAAPVAAPRTMSQQISEAFGLDLFAGLIGGAAKVTGTLVRAAPIYSADPEVQVKQLGDRASYLEERIKHLYNERDRLATAPAS